MRRAQNNKLYDFPSEKGKGIIGTVIFHIVLAIILIVTGFHTPLPLPEEEGILVNFGTDETGSGLLEPAPSSSTEQSSITEPEEPSSEEIVEVSRDEQFAAEQQEEAQMTQEFEEAPVVEKKVEQPDPEEIRKREEAERIRQQQLDEERKRREAEAAAEAERKRVEEEQRRRTEIMNRTRNALERANARGSDTSGEGITEGAGNQGVETGAVNANVYGEGSGTGTEGISYNLAGRQSRSLPKPAYDIQNEGIVVVEVTVDRNGNVTNANPGVKGSTTLEEYFLRVAREAAMQAKFDRKPEAQIQKGTITYHFILR